MGCSKPLFPFPISKDKKHYGGSCSGSVIVSFSVISNDDVATAFLAPPDLPMPCHSSELYTQKLSNTNDRSV